MSTIHNVESTILDRSSNTVGATVSDPVSDAIALLRPRSEAQPGLHAAEPWAVRFEKFPFVTFGSAVRGQCWLTVEGEEPTLLREGDFYLLNDPPSYALASSPDVTPQPAGPLWASASGGVARIGAEAEEVAYICTAAMSFDEVNAPILLGTLPPLVHIPATDPHIRQIASVTQMLGDEIESRAIGRSLVLDHLAQILFVQVLRAHVAQTEKPVGWLGALHDDGIGASIRAMHADIAHRWTLDELARISNLSRSAFAASFKKRVGLAPVEYLIQWRMSLARDALRRDTRSISELASATGYESESAFSTAFRRVVGSSPRQYREAAHRAARS